MSELVKPGPSSPAGPRTGPRAAGPFRLERADLREILVGGRRPAERAQDFLAEGYAISSSPIPTMPARRVIVTSEIGSRILVPCSLNLRFTTRWGEGTHAATR